jgi:hypothetical protein
MLNLPNLLLVLFFTYELPVSVSYQKLTRPRTEQILSRARMTEKHISRNHHPQLGDITIDTENAASSVVACVYRVVAWQHAVQIHYIFLWKGE